MSERSITITKDGPYLVRGAVPLANQHIVPDPNEPNDSLEWKEGASFPLQESYALCRCGQSAKKPYCDGTHRKVGFDGTETASRQPFDAQAKVYDGPALALKDAEPLCAAARFCHPEGSVWNLVRKTADARARALVIHEAGHCPSGRLVAVERATGEALEPEHAPSLGLVQDTSNAVSGPIWVRGGIAVVSADGTTYEVRNRVTLCRCGQSGNKPFCDGSHIAAGFDDGSTAAPAEP